MHFEIATRPKGVEAEAIPLWLSFQAILSDALINVGQEYPSGTRKQGLANAVCEFSRALWSQVWGLIRFCFGEGKLSFG